MNSRSSSSTVSLRYFLGRVLLIAALAAGCSGSGASSTIKGSGGTTIGAGGITTGAGGITTGAGGITTGAGGTTTGAGGNTNHSGGNTAAGGSTSGSGGGTTPVSGGAPAGTGGTTPAGGIAAAGGTTIGTGGAAAGGTTSTSTAPGWGAPVTGGPSGTGTAATVTVNPNMTTGTIGADYTGFSYEKTHIMNGSFTSNNTNMIALYKLLGSPMMRIGANDVEVCSWAGNGTAPTQPNGQPFDTKVTTGGVDQLCSFLAATNGSKVIYGVNFRLGNVTASTAEAAYVMSKCSLSIVAFEIGNELDKTDTWANQKRGTSRSRPPSSPHKALCWLGRLPPVETPHRSLLPLPTPSRRSMATSSPFLRSTPTLARPVRRHAHWQTSK